jgi:hypothetical protein
MTSVLFYRPNEMSLAAHRRLEAVLRSDPETGRDSSVSKGKGSMISFARQRGYQADHSITILFHSCEHGHWKKGHHGAFCDLVEAEVLHMDAWRSALNELDQLSK